MAKFSKNVAEKFSPLNLINSLNLGRISECLNMYGLPNYMGNGPIESKSV